MLIREISIALEDTSGKLSEMADCLRENGVTILALNVAKGAEVTAVRLVTNDPDKAANTLRTHSYQITEKDVVAVEVPDHPGGLNAVLRPLKERSIEIRSLYTCFGAGEKALLIMDVDRISDAVQGLQNNWVRVLNEEIYRFGGLEG